MQTCEWKPIRENIGRTVDYIVNERESAILHTVVSDTLEAFASEVICVLQKEVDELRAENERLHKIIDGLEDQITDLGTLTAEPDML